MLFHSALIVIFLFIMNHIYVHAGNSWKILLPFHLLRIICFKTRQIWVLPFFFFLQFAGAYKLCQTLIFHLEFWYANISLHTFLNKTKNTPACFQKYLAVERRAVAYYLNIAFKQSFKRTVGCLCN